MIYIAIILYMQRESVVICNHKRKRLFVFNGVLFNRSIVTRIEPSSKISV